MMKFEDWLAIRVKLCCSSLFAEFNTVQCPKRYSAAEGSKVFHSSISMKLWVGKGKNNLGKYGDYLPQNSVFHFKVVFPLTVQETEE